MADIVVIGGGFGGRYFAEAVGAPVLTRGNGYDINGQKIIRELKRLNPRIVVNFASQSMVGQSWSWPTDWMQTNCVGLTSLLITLMHNAPRLERYIHFTTPEVYGSTDGWIKESWDFRPSTPYAASRACGDWMVKLWHEQYGLPAIFTRAANIYGEGQQLYRLIPKAILAKMEGQAFPLEGGGKSVRSFVHMDDVTEALMLLIDKGTLGDTYHISPSNAHTIREVCSFVGCETHDAPERPGKDDVYLLNSSKIKDMGWRAKVSLPAGIQRVEKWMAADDKWRSWPREYVHCP